SGGAAHTLSPTSALPVVTDPVVIDGTTQPGFAVGGSPVIELDGTAAGATASGLVITAGNSTVRGLVINRFGSGGGIELNVGGGNVVAGCLIGTDATGVSAASNNGVGILTTSSNNRAGGTNGGEENLIAF